MDRDDIFLTIIKVIEIMKKYKFKGYGRKIAFERS